MDPLVSLPIANGTAPAHTAPAGPLEEPLVQRRVAPRLAAGPVGDASGLSYPMPPAISMVASLAASTAPAARSRVTTVASRCACWATEGCAPQVVGAPTAATMSFSPYGMPCSGPRSSPL